MLRAVNRPVRYPPYRLFLVLLPVVLFAQNSPPQTLYEQCASAAKDARGAFQRLQASYPGSPYALFLLGESKAEKQQYAAALERFTKAAEQMPGLRGIYAAIALAERAQGNTAKALSAEASEQKLDPLNCAAEKVACAFEAGRFSDAIAEAKGTNSAESLYWLARASRAIAGVACDAAEALPESSESHAFEGRRLRDAGNYRDAIAEWRAALKLTPGDLHLKQELAASLFFTQDYKGILPELRQLLASDPRSADLNFFIGDSLFETEQLPEALPYLETALKLDPKLTPAHVALGLCEVRLGHAAQAIPHLKAGLALDRDGSIDYQLARAYQATGQPGLAKKAMERYTQLHNSAAPSAPAP